MDLIAVLFLLWLGRKWVGKGNHLPHGPARRLQAAKEGGVTLPGATRDPKFAAATHQFMSYFQQLSDHDRRAVLARLNERQTKQLNHLCNQAASLNQQQQLDLIVQQERNGLYQELAQWAASDGASLMNPANRWWSFNRR